VSFISSMKDKMEVKNKQSVLHKLDEGQNGGEKQAKCPS
jgi:hypothetical protein